ncbi:MAG: FtsK/SpoIIIE domain-containing protein [Terrimicrobiaceae bacterium]|nr:FtsK/SpoIIIE domain-containing protein [Terrimicrobiaceae bacterium]
MNSADPFATRVDRLSVVHGLKLLDRLHHALATFSKEEADLARRLRQRHGAILRSRENGIENSDHLLATQTDAAEEAFSEEKRRVAAKHERRRARIRAAAEMTIRSLPRRAQAERERWLGELQMRHFSASRRLQAERNAADAALENFLAAVAERRANFQRLDRRARDYFTGYLGFLWKLHRKQEDASVTGSREELFDRLGDHLSRIDARLAEFRRFLLPKIFSFAPLPVVIPLIAFLTFLFIRLRNPSEWIAASLIGGMLAAGLAVLHSMGKRQSATLAADVIASLAEVQRLLAACGGAASSFHRAERERIEAEVARADAEIDDKWEKADEIKASFAARARQRLDTHAPRALARNEEQLRDRMERIEARRIERLEQIRRDAEALRSGTAASAEAGAADFQVEQERLWSELDGRWQREIAPIYAEVAEMKATAEAMFPEWTPEYVAAWTPRNEFIPATRFARLDVDIPSGPRLKLPGPARLSIPLALSYPGYGSVLFETSEPVGTPVISCLNQIVLRLLATTPPGKLSFTICDPVGLGRNFAGLMHLGDYEESLITRRIWTQTEQIEERLADLSQHIEKVIQMYLRDEYATIVEYNAQAASTAEKFHFLVVADFPANFSETAIKRLQSIVTSGPRCGVYTLIHWDQRQPLPSGFVADELRGSSICIQGGRNGLALEHPQSMADARLLLDAAPEPELALEFIQKVGRSSIDSNQIQVPFRQIAPNDSEIWTGDTTNELRVAIGRAGATKHQILAIGKGTRQHALIAGKTGSGKSTLLHVIITNLALSCSPEQVEFYLIDFKKGVEFKCYATKRLPHAKVVAIESDREFGLSVLQRIDEELRRRGDLFRKLGVQDVAGYKREGGREPMPRCLLIIDEFQEFFVEDDAISQSASVLLDRIVRQGRAFGIHVILGSQTLGGAYSLARATLGQMVIRIALQCNEADAYLIMDDGNAAPRLLSRPGEGIYNDAAGAFEGNSPFQVCWLPDEERDAWLDKVRGLANRKPELDAAPIVFEGNAPANIRENALLAKVLRGEPQKFPLAAHAWLGAPNAIKGPTEIVFHRQSGNNLLIVGQRDEAALAMLGNSLLALAAQYPRGAARFFFLHQEPPGSANCDFIERVIEATSHNVTVGSGRHVAEILEELATELKQRMDGELPAKDAFLFIHGLQRFRKLRHEDDFDFSSSDRDAAPKPGAQLAEVIAEGSAHGIHILASVDTFNSVNRFMNRKALSEFEMRVAFQMSANDSASLIDSPKAGGLGLHRALFYNEHEGTLETFRPYAMPDAAWLEEIAGEAPPALQIAG